MDEISKKLVLLKLGTTHSGDNRESYHHEKQILIEQHLTDNISIQQKNFVLSNVSQYALINY